MKFLFVFLLLMVSSSSFTACGSSVDANDEPEFPDADFVWRVCNEHEEYAIEDFIVQKYYTNNLDSLTLGTLAPGKCSKYYAGPYEGEGPVNLVNYKQDNRTYSFVYLANWPALRGLADSTQVQYTPGRYSYHFIFEPDTTKPPRSWATVEIEREKYH